MKKFDKEHLIFFDVDDTLVMHGMSAHKRALPFIDPYDLETKMLVPHRRHIKMLKDQKIRGSTIVVWSAAGKDWAEIVLKTLDLLDFVDLIMSKPSAYVDDLESHQILGNRVYLQDNDEKVG